MIGALEVRVDDVRPGDFVEEGVRVVQVSIEVDVPVVTLVTDRPTGIGRTLGTRGLFTMMFSGERIRVLRP